MTDHDETFDRVVRSLPALLGNELDELLARATHVAINAVCITDAQLDLPGPHIVYVNPAFERMTGYTAAEVIGRDPRFLQGPATDRRVLARLRSDLEAGRPFQGETLNYRKDGTPFAMSWRIAAVSDGTGKVSHYVAAQEDLSALRDAEQLLREEAEYLLESSEWLGHLVDLAVQLARASNPTAVLGQVAEAAVEALGAEMAAIVLVDHERSTWELAAASGAGRGAEPGSRITPEPASLIGRVLASGAPELHPHSDLPIGAGLTGSGGTVAVMPLGDASPYGVVALSFARVAGFRRAERAHLDLLARLTTLTHRNAQALEGQISVASELQAALLPTLGDLPGLELAWQYLAVADHSVVGGDWYDAVELPGGRVALFVGDVVGHGPPAAALMGEVRFTTRGLLRAFDDPGPLLDQLDTVLLGAHAPGHAMATMCALVIEPDGTLRYSSAGHPHPVVRRTDGRIDVLEGAHSRLLGASPEGGRRVTATDHLAPGDCLVAFSDGVFESRGTDYDDAYRHLLERLHTASTDPRSLCDAVVGDRLADPGHPAFRDDVVVLAARRTERP
ncbi:SpoIIE family protein phosphatase [soil metagenome]